MKKELLFLISVATFIWLPWSVVGAVLVIGLLGAILIQLMIMNGAGKPAPLKPKENIVFNPNIPNIQLIKEYRVANNCSLKEAKEAISEKYTESK